MTNHSLLFVDDEPNIVQSLSLLFDDYKVYTAGSGLEALNLFKKGVKIDVLISDQRMPQMTGVELLQQVKAISPGTVRILLTGYADLDAVIESVNTGEIFRYVNKPWISSKLKDTVKLACQFADKVQNSPPASPKPPRSFASTASLGILSAIDGIPSSEAKPQILFVDPKPSFLEAYRELLKDKYEVYTALNPKEAFEILLTHGIQVLISEVALEGISGAEFLAAVSIEYPDIVSILLSDSRDANIAIRLINEAQVFRYLVKPFKRELLKTTIELAISRHHESAERPEANSKVFHRSFVNLNSGEAKNIEDALNKARQISKLSTTY
ncbi:MAG: response regulator [Chloroherpetonaceae bacterium]|nr:response regulator [Chloroherpetonaceae bacterium]